LLTTEPFGGGEYEDLPITSLATDRNLGELTDILEDLDTWVSETPEVSVPVAPLKEVDARPEPSTEAALDPPSRALAAAYYTPSGVE
jgi:hypothetical protein